MASPGLKTLRETILKELVSSSLIKNFPNTSAVLSSWQKDQLNRVDSELGVNCLLRMWLLEQTKLTEGLFCNATWDNHYCWPYTPAGTTASLECSEAFRESEPQYASHLQGTAFRTCLSNGSWQKGNWTNYTECADSYDDYVAKTEEENLLRIQVRWIVFVGSILSLVCLLAAISIFCTFRSIWCDRVTVHMHLMVSLVFRYVMLYIITEAFIFDRKPNYRSLDWICKTVLSFYLYFTVCSVNWMLIQGIYLNSKLTTNVFDKEAPFKLYFIYGWLLPIPLLGFYAGIMEISHPIHCWKGYSDMDEIWIILVPIIGALVVNLFLLLNILWILLTKAHRSGRPSDVKQFQRAAKATLILSPILGINNLLFIHNPGGIYHKYYVILNSTFGSTQGVFVALVYCYLSSDVCNAIRRCYLRFLARRSANRSRMMRQERRGNSSSTDSGIIIEQPVHLYRSNRVCSPSNPTRCSSATQLCPSSTAPSITQLVQNSGRNNNSSSRQHGNNLGNRNGILLTCNPFLSRTEYESREESGAEHEQVMIPLSELI